MIEKIIDEYFDQQHATLWGRSFNIFEDKDRIAAKEWVLDLLIDLGITEEHVDDGTDLH